MGGKYKETQIPNPLDPNDGLTYPGGYGECDVAGWGDRHIKLPNVTAIFPSITFASWASIFTGKMPSETGILGQEFFARDLINNSANGYSWKEKSVPGLRSLPPGMVALDADGLAFKPERSTFFAVENVIPVEFSALGIHGSNTLEKKLQVSAPGAALTTQTLWNDINALVASKYQIGSNNLTAKCEATDGECRTVSVSNQYAMSMPLVSGELAQIGADRWATPDNTWQSIGQYIGSLFNAAKVMDKSATYETMDFLSHYYDNLNASGKKKRFPAMMSVYFSGLDHEAHADGMEKYPGFFRDMTDSLIESVVKKLKEKDEFDNKLFIIVADHGHTAMPEDLKYVPSSPQDGLSRPAEMSCKLAVNGFNVSDVREAEQANNNLHIWELGEVFKAVGSIQGSVVSHKYKVLAPQPISNLYTATTSTGLQYELPYGATSDINKANVIAALNGPMAHIYLKGPGGWSDENPDIQELTILANYLKGYLKDGGVLIADKDVKKNLTRLLFSVDRILMRVNGVYKDFIGVQLDANYNVIGPNAATISETYFDANSYVAAFDRIEGMNHPKRSGDIVLVMKDEVHIPVSEIANQRFTTGVACKSWHGSLNLSDSYIPFIVAYPGGNKFEIQPLIDSTDGCNSATGCDGNWRVTDLTKTILQKQFGSQ